MKATAALPTLLLFTLILSACTPRPGDPAEDERGQITGTVTYRERIALQPGSTVRVRLEDVSRADVPRALVAETSTLTERQVPIPFTLAYDRADIDPAHVYTVRAEILDPAGTIRWRSTAHYPVLTQGNPAEVEILVHPASQTGGPDTTRVWHYACTGLRFNVRFGEDRATLFLPDTTYVLPITRSASGARYEGNGVLFWSKGDSAQVVVNDTEYTDCAVFENVDPWERARRRGVDFRAVGNEPGWYLDIFEGDSLVAVTAYGEQRAATPYPESVREGNRTTYTARTEAHDLHIVIEDTPCQDTMSGEAFENTVTMTLDGETYQGCGRSL